jgi:ADP-ribosyl-[dinitrogen reductase] hydrolase
VRQQSFGAGYTCRKRELQDIDMLIELAVGDAYGAGFEYVSKTILKHNDLSGYIQHPRHKGIRPGYYTDDTQMSLAIAEAIVTDDPWTTESLLVS